MLELFHRLLLLSHVTAGVTGLVTGPLVMATHKGGPAHRRWGKIFYWAMCWVCASTFLITRSMERWPKKRAGFASRESTLSLALYLDLDDCAFSHSHGRP